MKQFIPILEVEIDINNQILKDPQLTSEEYNNYATYVVDAETIIRKIDEGKDLTNNEINFIYETCESQLL